MITAQAPNFELREFERVSDRALTTAEMSHAAWHAEQLQRVRNALNATFLPASRLQGDEWRIRITSFVRSGANVGGGDHANGVAVDWNVVDIMDKPYVDLTRWARDWLATNPPGLFAELLWEDERFRTADLDSTDFHVHQARRGYSKDESANAEPQILDLLPGGDFVQATIAQIPKPAFPIALGALALGALFLFRS